MFKKILFFIIFCCITLSVFSSEWRELSSEHFIIYYKENENFAKEVSYKAEKYYNSIASDIGYSRYSNFWTWDKRVKIYIYPTKKDYLKETNQPDWSEGMADYKNKQILSYALSEGFLDSILPHEMAHLIFRDFVGFKSEIPLWLDEGVAQWAENLKRANIKKLAKELYQKEFLLSLKDIMTLDIRSLKDKNKVFIRPTKTKSGEDGVLFIGTEQLITNYYIQSASIVGFLIEKYGSYSFSNFCRELRDGKSVEEAIRIAYPHIVNLEELETLWRRYLERE